MFLNYIAISVSAVMVLLSIAVTVASGVSYNTNTGRIIRRIRIVLRELSFTAVIVTALILLIIGKIAGDSNKDGIWLDISLIFLSYIILHGSRLMTMKRSRKPAHRRMKIGTIRRTPHYKHMAELAKELTASKELPLAKTAEAK